MGHPSQEGGKVQAASAAQIADKAFPPGTEPAVVAMAKSMAQSADADWRRAHQSAAAEATGSPVVPEIRQVRPAAQMGEGYHDAGPDDPH